MTGRMISALIQLQMGILHRVSSPEMCFKYLISAAKVVGVLTKTRNLVAKKFHESGTEIVNLSWVLVLSCNGGTPLCH